MEEFTRKFNVAQEKDAEIRHILTTVYAALEDKGYNPINQIVGYILSEDPTYITNLDKGGKKCYTAKSYKTVTKLQIGYKDRSESDGRSYGRSRLPRTPAAPCG